MCWLFVSHFNICIAFISRTLSAHALFLSLTLSNRRYFMACYVFIVIFFGYFVSIRRVAPSRTVKFHFHSLCLLFIYLFSRHSHTAQKKFSLSHRLSYICCWLFSAVCKKIHLHDHVNWTQNASCIAFNSIVDFTFFSDIAVIVSSYWVSSDLAVVLPNIWAICDFWRPTSETIQFCDSIITFFFRMLICYFSFVYFFYKCKRVFVRVIFLLFFYLYSVFELV